MPDHTDQPYNDGGWIWPDSYVNVTLDPDECILVRRTARWVCGRDHEHGDQSILDMLNALDQFRPVRDE